MTKANPKSSGSHPHKILKTQSSLHSFLGLADTRVPGYFHLDWENKVATFMEKAPVGVVWKDMFNWRTEKREVMLTCSLKSGAEPSTFLQVPRGSPYDASWIPFLKSHLQKCVRRQRSDLAVKSALHLMQIDLTAFLRRRAIILLEDAMLHIHYPVLVWLMSAVSRGYQLPDECIAWILGHVCATTAYQMRLLINSPDGVDIGPVNLNSKSIHSLPAQERDLIYALQMRKAYGGMSGDGVLLEEISHTLVKLLTPTKRWPSLLTKHFKFPITLIHPHLVKPLGISEWELAGIDFHVSDINEKWYRLLDSNEARIWTKERLKEVMWSSSGGTNRRSIILLAPDRTCVQVAPDIPDGRSNSALLWSKYESRVHSLAKSLLEAKVMKSLSSS